MKPDVRCVVCTMEFHLESVRKLGYKTCPQCQTPLPPVLLKNDGYIKANWQDMRMLAIFAKRWTARFDTTNRGNRDSVVALDNICKRLESFRPEGAEPLLGRNDQMQKPAIPTLIGVSIGVMSNSTPYKLKDGSVISPYFQPSNEK